MFKIYGVTDTASTAKKSTSHTHHDDHHDDHAHHDHHEENNHDHHDNHTKPSHHTIEVDIRDDADHETDIGQIAVDILDTTSSIVIIAPIA